MQSYYVYILKCADASYYIGHTDNLESRLVAHQQKLLPSYTNTRLPVQLVFLQEFGERDEAFAAERKLKGWSRKKKEALINGEHTLLRAYSKKKFL